MQTIQHATKTPHSYSIRKKLLGTIFYGGRTFGRKGSKSSAFINSISCNFIQYIFISKGAVFVCAIGKFETGFKLYFKTILIFLNNQLLE